MFCLLPTTFAVAIIFSLVRLSRGKCNTIETTEETKNVAKTNVRKARTSLDAIKDRANGIVPEITTCFIFARRTRALSHPWRNYSELRRIVANDGAKSNSKYEWNWNRIRLVARTPWWLWKSLHFLRSRAKPQRCTAARTNKKKKMEEKH